MHWNGVYADPMKLSQQNISIAYGTCLANDKQTFIFSLCFLEGLIIFHPPRSLVSRVSRLNSTEASRQTHTTLKAIHWVPTPFIQQTRITHNSIISINYSNIILSFHAPYCIYIRRTLSWSLLVHKPIDFCL
jgi:hypothetical protein